MLQTQVQYWSLQEQKRHNIVTENQTDFANTEVKRHNLATEGLTDWFNRETKRHNMSTESIGRTQASAALQQAYAANRQADAAQAQAKAAAINAFSNWYNARTNRDLALTQGELNESAAAKNKKQTSYLGQENVRSWINTGANVLNSISRLQEVRHEKQSQIGQQLRWF